MLSDIFCKHPLRARKGQTLFELIMGISIGIIILGAVAGTATIGIRSNLNTKRAVSATGLARELSDNLRSFAESNWHRIASLTYSSSAHYYLNTGTAPFTIQNGKQSVTIEDVQYTRYFYFETVGRESCGRGKVTSSPPTGCSGGPLDSSPIDEIANDSSTIKAVVVTTWPGASTGIVISEYITRSKSFILFQSDWTNYGIAETATSSLLSPVFTTSTNIAYGTSLTLAGSAPYPLSGTLYSPTFDTENASGAVPNSIVWQGTKPSGTAVKFQIGSSNCTNGASDQSCALSGEVGTPNGDQFSSTEKNHQAWNEALGWIDFGHGNADITATELTGYANTSGGIIALNCASTPNGNICATSNFKVSRSGNTLSGYAWSEAAGWISFNCSDLGICGTSNYAVTIDANNGSFLGYAWSETVGWISFNCNNNNSCATSDFKLQATLYYPGWDFLGPDGSSLTYYTPSGPNVSAMINPFYHMNRRYLRYRVILEPNGARDATPSVESVSINASH